MSLRLTWNSSYHTRIENQTALIDNVDKIIDTKAYCCYPNTTICGYVPMMIAITNNKWPYFSMNDYTIKSLTLQYTKTTDQASS